MDFLCLDFINTQWYLKHDPFKEYLEDAEWVKRFCSKWNLPVPDLNFDTTGKLLQLRDDLFFVALQICMKEDVSCASIDKLNRYLKGGNYRRELRLDKAKFHIDTIPESDDIDWMIYSITLSFSELISNYDINRIKKCQNPGCDWVFYDNSKSHTKKWCDNRCASLMKVRKYRERKKKH